VGWDHPEFTLNPGEGAIVNSRTNWTITFVGEVLQGSLTNPYPAGFSIRASQVPQAGTASELGLSAFTFEDFNSIYKFNTANQSYDFFVLFLGTWANYDPNIGIGESVWLQTQSAGSWNRTFTIQ
jgi:hypothetical protein